MYDTAKHPRTGEWWLVGDMGKSSISGRKQFLPIVGPFATEKQAIAAWKRQLLIDRDAKRCVLGI